MTNGGHLTDRLLIRDLDEAVTSAEAARIDLHLTDCNECKQRYQRWNELSMQLESLVAEAPKAVPNANRDLLERKLKCRSAHQARIPVLKESSGALLGEWGLRQFL